MIPSVNELLGSVLTQVGVPLRFETPSSDWTKDAPTGGFLSAFLYQVRDETNAQNVGWDDVYGEDGRVVGRRPPDRYFRFAYLVTAWAATNDVELALLGEAMRAVVEREALGVVRDRQAASIGTGSPKPATSSSPADFDESSYLTSGNSWVTVGSTHLSSGIAAHDVLSSVGVPLRSSLDLVAVAPLRLQVQSEAGPPTESMTLGMNKILTTPGAGEAKKDPLADRKFSALRLREDSEKPRPIRRQI